MRFSGSVWRGGVDWERSWCQVERGMGVANVSVKRLRVVREMRIREIWGCVVVMWCS